MLSSVMDMKAREVVQRILELGGLKVREGKGSHVLYCCACKRWQTVVPNHKGEDVKPGTLRAIEKQLEPCAKFGKGWLLQ